MLALVCVSGLVTGCDQASEAASRQFDEQFRTNCISAASGGQLPQDLVAKACDCALAKINERYGTAEKLTLTNEQAQPIAAECLAEVKPANG
jgi:hypothetical protein